jgi:hypothetical protein
LCGAQIAFVDWWLERLDSKICIPIVLVDVTVIDSSTPLEEVEDAAADDKEEPGDLHLPFIKETEW